MVQPKMQSSASSFVTFFAVLPTTATSSASYWNSSPASFGFTIGSPWAMIALGER